MYYLQSRYYNPETRRFLNADAFATTGQGLLGNNMFAYCNNNPVNSFDSSGMWPKWLSGALNVASGVLQAVAGAALIATTGWSGAGAVVGAFLMVNGAATATQGIGQIVNTATNANTLREDNIIRTQVQDIGQAVGGNAGSEIAGGLYDGAVIGSGLYAGSTLANTIAKTANTYMPKVINSKLFSANNGYGIKIGKHIEMFYRNPYAAGGTGGTIFSYKGPLGKFRIDWDPAHGFHAHPPGHK